MTIETNGIINNYTVAITAVVFLLLLIKTIKIKGRIYYTFFTGFLLFLYVFIGWEYISYNHDSPDIGKKVHLSGQLYILDKTKKIFSSDAVKKSYDSLVVLINQPAIQSFYEENYPNSTIKQVDPKKIYTIVDSFRLIRIGFLQFGVSGLQYIVFEDENGLKYAQYKGYDEYLQNTDPREVSY